MDVLLKRVGILSELISLRSSAHSFIQWTGVPIGLCDLQKERAQGLETSL